MTQRAPLPGVYPEESTIQKDTCTPLFTAALFTVARNWKQPWCPLTDERIEKLWHVHARTHTCIHTHIHTMQSYSVIQRNGFESVVVRWMKLEPVIESEVNQKGKNKYILKQIYMESRKIVLMNPFTGKEWRHRCREQACGYSRGRRRWDELRK